MTKEKQLFVPEDECATEYSPELERIMSLARGGGASAESKTLLPTNVPLYEAYSDEEGDTTRQAFTVGELPVHLRMAALRKAEAVLGVESISFGVPIFETLGMTKRQAEVDRRGWILYRGSDLPLDYFWHR